jgi:SAM-dependent methyltransferase
VSLDSVVERLRRAYYAAIRDRSEERKIVSFLLGVGATPAWRILDVGCGFGRNLFAMRSAGLHPAGIDVNPATVAQVREHGFPCFEPHDPALDDAPWDALVLAHVIEHFAPEGLIEFLESHLARLKVGGYVVLATPLLHHGFYEDFDHVKPYTPFAIAQFFGPQGQQVQRHAADELELVDVWFRRSAPLIRYRRGLFVSGNPASKVALGSANVLLRALHLASMRVVGQTTGWIGLYRKSR